VEFGKNKNRTQILIFSKQGIFEKNQKLQTIEK